MSATTNEANDREDFKVWQQNLCKSYSAWEHLLHNLYHETYNLACIQEPFLNSLNLTNASSLS
ncbi:hypothetical protein DEU56DRAFT_722287 [Suillus clintonianus]|uniref:uncharacterized protein n=1 Tax=Suillus clintonianus TaxID=1904413 RepID=UPI001B88020A|nr:uncharacterized protein DEU56DRAFT_722287 [Suillus clintonianus]KAG2156985.1 hypothetical protein DEU56DRAFT_722287 [Suillus clintonianus]